MQFDRRIQLACILFALWQLLGANVIAQTPCQGGRACNGTMETTVTVSDEFPSQVPPWTEDLAVPSFDVTLGTLARVDIAVTVPIDGFFGAENLNVTQGCLGGIWNVASHVGFVFAPGNIQLLNEAVGISDSFGPLSVFDGSIDYGGTSGETDVFMDIISSGHCLDDPSVLDEFRSDVAGPELAFTALTSVVLFTNDSNCNPLASLVKLNAGAQIEVTYTYCVPAGIAFCAGDGSGTPCPCGNAGAPSHGCANGSSASGSSLAGSGTASVSMDTLALIVADATPNQPGLFFQGDNAIQGGIGAIFGDGLRCAGGNVVRLEVVTAGGSGSASSTAPVAAAGNVSAGDIKRYQWWYRDPTGSPCGTGFNLSNGFEVTWAP